MAPQEILQAVARKRPDMPQDTPDDDDSKEFESKEKKCQFEMPEWREHPGCPKYEYRPKFNMGPTMFVPVMASGVHFGLDKDTYVVQPMHWGLVPSWHKVGIVERLVIFFESSRLKMNSLFLAVRRTRTSDLTG